MTLRGHIHNGAVVLDEPAPAGLAEGAQVEVRLIDGTDAGPPRAAVGVDGPTWGEVLGDLIGAADGLPPDMAENHDHYIHGTPRRPPTKP